MTLESYISIDLPKGSCKTKKWSLCCIEVGGDYLYQIIFFFISLILLLYFGDFLDIQRTMSAVKYFCFHNKDILEKLKIICKGESMSSPNFEKISINQKNYFKK